MKEFKCPNCDAPSEVPENSSTVVCQYCNTTVQVETGEIVKESYIMRLQYDLNAANERMRSWALKQLGVPKGLETKAEIKESKLIFWPFWVVEIEAEAEYKGTQKKPNFEDGDTASTILWKSVPEDGHLDMEKDIFIPAAANVPKHLARHIIPTKRKEFFNQEMVRDANGFLQPIVVEHDEAIEKAKLKMTEILHEEAKKEVDKVTEMQMDLKAAAVFLVQIPVWHIKYDYSVRSYDAMIDGASGRIIYLEFPRKVAFRAMTFLGGLIHLIAGGGLGLLLVYLGIFHFDLITPTIFGVIFGLGMLVISLRFIRTAISLKAGEEGAE